MIATSTALAMLGAPESDSALVAAIVERATATLQRDLGFYLGTPATRTEYLSGFGTELTVVDDVLEPTDEEPITVAQLSSDWEWETEPTTHYRRLGRVFIHRYGWTPGSRNVRIVYRSGWAADAGPGELRDLVLRLVAMRYRDAASDGVQSETLSDYSYTLKQDVSLAAEWAETVRRYSRRLPI